MTRARAAVDVAVGLTRLIGAVPLWRVRTLTAVRRYGLTIGALAAVAAVKNPGGTALVDEAGPMTYAELDRGADELAAVVARRLRPPAPAEPAGAEPAGAEPARAEPAGAGAGETVATVDTGPSSTREIRLGVLCRNGRAFVLAVVAGARLGAEVVLLNADFSPAELATTLHDEQVELVLFDGDDLPALPTETAAVDLRDPRPATSGPRARVARTGQIVVLTSGTTGPAKGAHRGKVRVGQAIPVTTLVRRIPLRAGRAMVLTPPLFHGFGFGFLALALAFGLPVLLSRRLDVDLAADRLRTSRGGLLVGVPPVLARVERASTAQGSGTTPEVGAVVSGAGLLHPAVAARLTAAYGPVVLNLYGSSEEGWSTLATPADLAVAPGTIGRPAAGLRVDVLDDDGRPVGPGEVGHLCVGGLLEFSHYTGGGGRRRLGGLSDSGDLAHRDRSGLLFVDGRADEMVVTGGENVFTTEVENVLLDHPAVAEARVDGVPDEEFGARLEASVVPVAGVDTGGLEDELIASARTRLARFKVPRRIHLVPSLPQTSTGKHRRPEI